MQKNRKLGSYPSFLIVVSLTVALFLIAFCGWLAIISKQLVSNVKQNIEVQVYLDKNLTQSQIDSVRNIIVRKLYIETKNNEPQIKFISKEVTAEKMLKETNEDYRSLLGENPYRNAFSLKIREKFFSEDNLSKIKTDLEQVGGIFEADYAKDFVDNINTNANRAYFIIAAIVIILLVAIVILINNTIRLALYSQRFIIRTMQLVGATDWFIQKPFIGRGILQGIIAGSFACGFILILQQIAIREIDGFSVFQDYEKLAYLFLGIILIGILIGIISTYQSMYRYLRVDLEELI